MNRNIIISGIALILLIGFVSAFGVSSPYWDGNPLFIERGTTKIVEINLQNMVGNEDVKVKADLVEGLDIASLSNNVYDVRAQTSNVIVPLKISIPAKANVGDVKRVKVDFRTIGPNNEGMISMGTGMSVAFDVNITEKQKGASDYIIPIAIVLVITLLIVIFVIVSRKKR